MKGTRRVRVENIEGMGITHEAPLTCSRNGELAIVLEIMENVVDKVEIVVFDRPSCLP